MRRQSAGSDAYPTLAPTPTEEPMAAHVNGEGILLADYQEELQRYQAALQTNSETYDPATASKDVIDDMVDQTLLAQAAEAQSYTVDDATLQKRIDHLTQDAGGNDALQSWEAQNHYSDASFRRALKRDMEATWMRSKIVDAVPTTAEQVHARQILVKTETEADSILSQLQAGTSFDTLASQYDTLTGGELGWFPKGYLLLPDVENAAFSLAAGSYSGVISTANGYHIIEVIEKDEQHALSPDALLFMQRQALEKWLDQQHSQGSIEITTP
jgi:peptidyl-prolyl cis-trans isomerase C